MRTSILCEFNKLRRSKILFVALFGIDESHSEFSGDRIAVYFTFTYWGQFYETAVVYFYPD